ncbi:aminotransferase class V-fold PLP-dependent enzyme [Paenibacillus massiliensis]|uniref:aminotransferase class V-fold PLP-dependent enzyme n=1 Tax=Paenibacillus massiliensis TaxID=225917 RepID=UPI0004BA567B|nr:aminotransferase class V-fold PLP-dependent enzyme [Paenibacillus massiliensis]
MLQAIIGHAAYAPRSTSEDYFQWYRNQVIGQHHIFATPYGKQRLLYTDWTASGRLYRPIEDYMIHDIGPLVANTHTGSNLTSAAMTDAYHEAKVMIKRHVHADEQDVILFAGTGMTGAVHKLQHLLGLKKTPILPLASEDRPLIIVTHMEHHSNQISWAETYAEVWCLPPGPDGLVDLNALEAVLHQHRERKYKIGAFTACSNVTGLRTPYHDMARIMHEHGGICVVDFAASAPYETIRMHTSNPLEQLDAICFSPHKFLGGPGSCGVLIMNSRLYTSSIPEQPGGGTVSWTNPWGEHRYLGDIEAREDGGTPGFLQAIRAALAIRLKEQMGIRRIEQRERQLTTRLLQGLSRISRVSVLAGQHKDRAGIVSLLIEGVHYNLAVRLLNDRFGIQARGGCSCAGTYGHYLLQLGPSESKAMTDQIDQGNMSLKLGWVRISLHPVMTDQEIEYILSAIEAIADHGAQWQSDYVYDASTNEWQYYGDSDHQGQPVSIGHPLSLLNAF